MSIERVRAYFRERNMEDRVQEFEVSSATVELAAQALNVKGQRIAKTLSFHVDDHVVLIVAAGDAKIDNRTYKHRFGEKAHLIAFDEVEALTGHAPGGVCPFALKPGVRVFLDESLKRFDSVWPAAGADHTAVFLKLNELEALAQPESWVDVCKEKGRNAVGTSRPFLGKPCFRLWADVQAAPSPFQGWRRSQPDASFPGQQPPRARAPRRRRWKVWTHTS